MLKIYKPIEGYEGLYLISDHGDIFSVGRTDALGRYKPPRYLKSNKKNGYNRVNLYDANGYNKVYAVHKLVLDAFKGSCPKGLVRRHLDGNIKNNHIDNLEYGTQQDNLNDAVSHGTTGKGDRNSQAKLAEIDIHNILIRLQDGDFGRDIAKDYNVSESNISMIKHGNRWHHIQKEAA